MSKYRGLKNYKDLRRSLLAKKGLKKAYDDLGPEFAVIDELIKQRKQKNMTQAELARKLGTKQAAISRFESGSYNPSVAFLRKISTALGKEMRITIK